MADEGFHEIQLSGKQLVFLFMATTVASVVIFLCGVLVGRGVREERASDSAFTTAPAAGETSPSETQSVSRGSTPTTGPPADDLSYYGRLQNEEVPKETLNTSRTLPPGESKGSQSPRPKGEVKSAPPAVVDATGETVPAEPPGSGFAIQVVALREAGEASAIVRHLTQKGYPAYVIPPKESGPVAMYRVRVGKYQDRSEAERVVRRLQQEERFKPFITK